MKIVVLDGFLTNPGDVSWGPLENLGETYIFPSSSMDQVISRMKDAGAVITNRIMIDAPIMDACPTLKYIGLLGTGYNYVDLDAASQRHITVCNVPAYSTYAVAQNTIALLLEITNKVSWFNTYVHKGNWRSPADPNIASVQLTELYGKKLGVIGIGDIGYQVAKIAVALGMKVLAYRRHPKPEWENESLKFVDLDTLYRESDVISLHCPLNDKTKGMLDKQAISKMKNGVVLLNAARGGLIDESAVIQALDSGKIAYAGVDVLSMEPPTMENSLQYHPNCIITPHVAWMPKETRQRLIDIVAGNLAAYQQGIPMNVVNK